MHPYWKKVVISLKKNLTDPKRFVYLKKKYIKTYKIIWLIAVIKIILVPIANQKFAEFQLFPMNKNKSNWNSSTQQMFQVVSPNSTDIPLLMTSAVSKSFNPFMGSIFST